MRQLGCQGLEFQHKLLNISKHQQGRGTKLLSTDRLTY